jgi:hypothetical protein
MIMPAGTAWPGRKPKRRFSKNARATMPSFRSQSGLRKPVFHVQWRASRLVWRVQMCREIRYPEQWRWLAMQGAHLIAYVNSAIGSANGNDLWRAHVISRAAETQRFVVGANNAAPDQTCSTLIVSPGGRVIGEAPIRPDCRHHLADRTLRGVGLGDRPGAQRCRGGHAGPQCGSSRNPLREPSRKRSFRKDQEERLTYE